RGVVAGRARWALPRVLRAGGYLGPRPRLPLDRRGDARRDAFHLLDSGADGADRGDRLLRRALDLADLSRDLVGRLGGLAGEALDLRGDHREAAPGLAGARCLERGV